MTTSSKTSLYLGDRLVVDSAASGFLSVNDSGVVKVWDDAGAPVVNNANKLSVIAGAVSANQKTADPLVAGSYGFTANTVVVTNQPTYVNVSFTKPFTAAPVVVVSASRMGDGNVSTSDYPIFFPFVTNVTATGFTARAAYLLNPSGNTTNTYNPNVDPFRFHFVAIGKA